MNKIIRGVVHGNTIELQENPGLEDGKEVQLTLKVLEHPRSWGEGLQKCAGALAHEPPDEDERILEDIYQGRKIKSSREIEE